MAGDRDTTSVQEFREIAREEARAVYEELGAVDADGTEWTLRGLMENFNVDRRTALQAIGLIAVGYAAPTAVLHAVSGTARADAVGQVGTSADPLTKLFTHALEVGDGANAVDFDSPWTANHNAISSATTITDANVIPYDCSVSGFTITLGSQLEENGGWAVLIDQTGSAGTNQVTITANSNIDGGANITVNHDHAVTCLWWDGSEWRSTRFIDSVDAGTVTTDSFTLGTHAISAILEAESAGKRMERGSESHDHGAASNDGWDSSDLVTSAVSFASSFGATPDVYTFGSTDIVTGISNLSTSGFTLRSKNYTTTDLSAVTVRWIAIGDE